MHLLDRLLLISDLFERDMTRVFSGTPLSSARMAVLWTVHHSGPVPQQAIADALDVSARNVSALVDALSAAGYVRRTSDPHDRRVFLIELTEEGTSLMETTQREHHDLSSALLDAVAPGDRPALERGLAAISERLATLVADAMPGDAEASR
ncbi:MarR family winged helix-turn-helix transcriptional regulator [Microbacterium sp. ZW T5_45]|uniref:MarR family winged helix-turn-helix transcriptional regulator n=1 Tax=Microbacterium sp. ZW T5_45 TaxID=3378080 RepID=UPI003853C11E